MTSRENLDSFSARMLAARRYAGLSQEEAAKAVGLAQCTMSKLETGQESSPDVVAFAKVYGVDPFWLALGEGPPPEDYGLHGETLADRLRAAREARGLSQSELASLVGMTPQGIRAIEIGETKDVTGKNTFTLADALRVSPRWLVTGVGRASDLDGVQASGRREEMPGAQEMRIARHLSSLTPDKLKALSVLLGLKF